jgi:hypothetical protein
VVRGYIFFNISDNSFLQFKIPRVILVICIFSRMGCIQCSVEFKKRYFFSSSPCGISCYCQTFGQYEIMDLSVPFFVLLRIPKNLFYGSFYYLIYSVYIFLCRACPCFVSIIYVLLNK